MPGGIDKIDTAVDSKMFAAVSGPERRTRDGSSCCAGCSSFNHGVIDIIYQSRTRTYHAHMSRVAAMPEKTTKKMTNDDAVGHNLPRWVSNVAFIFVLLRKVKMKWRLGTPTRLKKDRGRRYLIWNRSARQCQLRPFSEFD